MRNFFPYRTDGAGRGVGSDLGRKGRMEETEMREGQVRRLEGEKWEQM